MSDTREPGEETAMTFFSHANPRWSDRAMWQSVFPEGKAAWAAAERRARTTGPLWEACKDMVELRFGNVSDLRQAFDHMQSALATMEQDPPHEPA